MKQNNIISIIFLSVIIVLFDSCSKQQPVIELNDIKNDELQIIEKGALVDDIREGYWITLSEEDKAILTESYYVNGVLNGPIKLYNKSGYLMSQGYMKNDSSNGLWTYYFDNGNINAIGSLQKGKRVGIWEFYVENGQLDKKILYENGQDSILVDNYLSVPTPPAPEIVP